MSKQTPQSWNVRPLNDADRQLASGRLVSAHECTDPISASLFLGLRAKQRLEAIRINRRPQGKKALVWTHWRARQEARLAFGSVGISTVSARALHAKLANRIFEFAAKNGRLGDTVPLSVAELSADVIPEFTADREFLDLVARIRSSGSSVLLQGSQADRKITNFSDFDFVIIGDMCGRVQKSLKREFDQRMIKFDPLQHHGSLFVDRTCLNCYWQSLLPLETLRQSRAMGHAETFNVRPLNETYGPINSLQGIVRTWEEFLANREIVRGMWDWKYKISQFLLIPTLVLAIGGVYAHKADSFDLTRELYSRIAWRSVEELTSVRAAWPSKEKFLRYRDVESRADGWLSVDFETVAPQDAVWRKKEFAVAASKLLEETRAMVDI